MESNNPYLDFKQSMEEMVEAHGVGSWESGLASGASWLLFEGEREEQSQVYHQSFC
uniref:OVATE domain-containing protein n=1 Tax=Kalanchoe fedtschenkoi TaxID=63787 RepID=A0A7N0VAM5_KALFE